MSRIVLTAIFKDDSEYDLAERMLQSFMPHVQGLVVGITGVNAKTQRLERLIKRHKGKCIITTPQTHPNIYHENAGKYFFANFAEARNVVFAEADKLTGYDWYTWADVDDVLTSPQELQKVADEAKDKNFDAVFFTYWYSVRVKKDGTFGPDDVVIEHARERLLRPKMFKWVSRLHEVAVPKDENYKPLLTQYTYEPKEGREMVWAHITDEKRSLANMQRNIQILELQVREQDRKDPRTILYLAKTYYDMRTKEYDDLALLLFDEYLNGKYPSGWAEERAGAWEYVANIFSRRGDHASSIKALHSSLAEYPNRHMTFLQLAKEYSELQNFEASDFWLNACLRMDKPETRTTISNPLEIKFMSASLKYNEAMRKQKLDDAIYWMKIRNQLSGQDDGMLKVLEESKLMNEAAKWVFNYAKWLKDTGNKEKIQKLLESLPFDLGREPFANFIANEVNEPKIWPNNSIVYFASWGGEHFEGWSPKNMQHGIGGSETAVIELTKRWVKMGYDVTVFCDPRDNEGDYEGVHYRPWYEMNWKDTFNILILWRSPHLMDREIKARRLLMDLHDVASQLDWNELRVQKVDKIMVKSNFHRKMLPKVPDEKIQVISNGI